MTTASAAADDSYQPAITMPTEPEAGEQAAAAAPAEAQPARPASPSRTAEAQAQAGDDAPAEDTARGPRQISPKVRAMFKDIAKRAAETGEIGGADDLVPMGTDSPPAAAAPVSAGAAQASPIGTSGQAAAAAAAAPLPTLRLPNPPPQTPRADDAAQSAAAQARAAEIERREQALAARESELSAREKLLPSRDRLAEAPADTLIGWLKETFGADDNEIKTLAADLMTEITERVHGTKIPDEIKAQLEGRRAVRSVKAVRANLDARERAIAEQKAAQEKAAKEAADKQAVEARDREYVSHIGNELAPHAATFKFLHDPKVTGGLQAANIVYEVYKEQDRLFREGKTTQAPDLAVAAKFADDYYKSKTEEAVKQAAYLQSLLAPASQPAKPHTSPGSAPGPAQTTQQKPAPQQPPVPPVAAEDSDPSDLPFLDRQERRRQSLAKIKAKYHGGA